MPLPTIPSGNVASALGGAFEVANSCRFDAGSDAYMHKTPGSAGNTGLKKFTFSTWVKRGGVATEQTLIRTKDGSNVECKIGFDASGELRLYRVGAILVTNAKYLDPGAWMHVVFAVDTTQASSSNRLKLFVNGTQVTSFSTETQPSADHDMKMCGDTLHIIGGVWTDDRGGDLDAYLAETVLIDGTQYAASDFGEFDEDSPTIWKPKDVSALTFGTNGFYLDYEDSSNLGNDANGGTDLTEVNIAAVDQALDSPTNNFCTMNPLDNYRFASTFTQGNNTVATGASTQHFNIATMGVSTGKWCWEVYSRSLAGAGYFQIGIVGDNVAGGSSSYTIGDSAYQYGWKQDTGAVRNNSSNASYGSAYQSTGIIIGVYLDLDNNKLYFTKDGTIENSGTGVSITAASSTPNGFYLPAIGDNSSNSGTVDFNFGATPFGDTAISSGNTDGEYGNFEYTTTITGDGSSKTFKALCTKNLAEYG